MSDVYLLKLLFSPFRLLSFLLLDEQRATLLQMERSERRSQILSLFFFLFCHLFSLIPFLPRLSSLARSLPAPTSCALALLHSFRARIASTDVSFEIEMSFFSVKWLR